MQTHDAAAQSPLNGASPETLSHLRATAADVHVSRSHARPAPIFGTTDVIALFPPMRSGAAPRPAAQ